MKKKRERVPPPQGEEEEEALASASKNPHVQQILVAWSKLGPEERAQRLQGSHFALLPQDLQRHIFQLGVDVIMLMAQVHPLFRVIALADTVWQMCYARDFPAEYAFCNGRLPIFVMGEGRLLSLPGDVLPEDEPAWKRFYLNTAHRYILMYKTFTAKYQTWLQQSQIATLNLNDKTVKGAHVRRWCHDYIFSKAGPVAHKGWTPWYAYSAKLAWYMQCYVVWFLSPAEVVDFSYETVIRRFWATVASNPVYAWTRPYLFFGAVSFKMVKMDDLSEYLDQDEEWLEYLHTVARKQSVKDLFVEADWARWTDLIETAPTQFDAERDRMARAHMKLILELFQACIRMPCVFSAYRPDLIYMCRESQRIESRLGPLISSFGDARVDFVITFRARAGTKRHLHFPPFGMEDQWGEGMRTMWDEIDARHKMTQVKDANFFEAHIENFFSGPDSYGRLREIFAEFARLPRLITPGDDQDKIRFIAAQQQQQQEK